MNSKASIVIAGANGYLGRYLCQRSLDQGYEVIGLTYDHFAPLEIDDPRIRYIHCDITKPVGEQIGANSGSLRPFAVINAAALLGSPDYDANYAVNTHGVQNLIDFCEARRIRRFIQISSVVVLKPVKGPYGETKLLGQEILCRSDLDYTVFIPAMVIGPESLGLNRVLKNIFRFPMVVPVIAGGRQTQHPVLVCDFVSCIVESLSNPAAFRKVYQIAGDTVLPFRELAARILNLGNQKKVFVSIPESVARVLGRIFENCQRVPLFTEEHVKGVLQDSSLDLTEIRRDLAYSPTSLEAALPKCLAAIGSGWSANLRPRPLSRVKRVSFCDSTDSGEVPKMS